MKTCKYSHQILVSIVLLLAVCVSTGQTKSLVGTNYVGVTFAVIDFDDPALDNGYSVGPVANINLSEQFDVQLSIGYLWADGDVGPVDVDVESFSGDAKLIFFVTPAENITPYLGAGVLAEHTEIEFSGPGAPADEDEVGFTGDIGVEVELNDNVLLDVAIDYAYIDSESATDITGSIGYWLGEQVLCGVGVSYNFDDEDIAGLIGLFYQF